eukprot:COSAG03_NODE_603_length_6750_cov_10.157119_3_plen_75_part_00
MVASPISSPRKRAAVLPSSRGRVADETSHRCVALPRTAAPHRGSVSRRVVRAIMTGGTAESCAMPAADHRRTEP